MADASIKAYFGGDTSGLRKAIGDATSQVEKFAGTLAKKFEGRDLARGLATALGLSVEKIGEKVARLFTGMTESAEKAYKEIEGLSERNADIQIKNMRATLKDEQVYQLLLGDRDRIQREIDNNSGKTAEDQARRLRDSISLGEKEAEIAQKKKDIDSAYAKEQEAFYKIRDEAYKSADERDKRLADERAKREHDTADAIEESLTLDEQLHRQKLETMTVDERLVALERDKRELQAQQKVYVKGSNDYKIAQISINETNKEIEQARLEIAQRTAKAEKEIVQAKKDVVGIAGIRGSEQFKDASDDALKELISRNTASAAAIRNRVGQSPSQVGGDIGQNLEIGRLESENVNLRRELEFRNRFRNDVSRGGRDQALKNFRGDPLQFDRVFSDVTSGRNNQDKQLTELEKIRNLLTGKFVNQ